MAREIKVEYGKLVAFTETEELTPEVWQWLVERYESKVLSRFGIPGIQTSVHQNHWLTNYMEFCNGQGTDDDGHSKDAHPE